MQFDKELDITFNAVSFYCLPLVLQTNIYIFLIYIVMDIKILLLLTVMVVSSNSLDINEV